MFPDMQCAQDVWSGLFIIPLPLPPGCVTVDRHIIYLLRLCDA
jgi:hypothetical protein